MEKSDGVARALDLAERIANLGAAERSRLKREIAKAAEGDELALCRVIFFPRDHGVFNLSRQEIFREIIFLILRAPRARAASGGGKETEGVRHA